MDRVDIVRFARAGLMICGGAFLSALPVVGLVYSQCPEAGPDEPGARLKTAGEQPRLPRSRPDEPVMTGSLQSPAPAGPSLADFVARDLARAKAVKPSPARSARITDLAAVYACEDKVRDGLPLPTSLKRSFSSTGVYRAPGDDPVVTFDFDALNGLGFPLAMQVQCVFSENQIARLEVAPR